MPNETKQSCATAYKTMIGGQALIEGIMMLGPEKKAVVVRKPDGGLEEQVEERVLIKDKHPALGLPLLRGVFNFCSSLANGVKALMYSASFFPEDEEEPEEPSRFELWLDRHLGSEKAASFFITVAVVLGIVFSVGLFILLPTALTGLVGLAVPLPMWLRNLLEGVVRIVIFMGYLMLCSHMKDIRRVFQYHGAEHKCINCVEHGLELNVENVRNSSREHKRCGTSFMLIVMVVSIIFFIFIRVESPILRVVFRIALVPVIAGVSYEFIRLAGRSENKLVLALSRPGMWMQGLTTREPDDGMIEVAIAAVEAVFDWRAWQGREPLETETEVVDEAEEAQLNAGDLEEILEEDAEEASDESTEPAAEEPKDVEDILEGKK